MNNPSLLGYPALGPQQQASMMSNVRSGTPTTMHQQLHAGAPPNAAGAAGMPPPGLINQNVNLNPNDHSHLITQLAQAQAQAQAQAHVQAQAQGNNLNVTNGAAAVAAAAAANGSAMGVNGIAPPNANTASIGGMGNAVNVNAKNPLYHPHLEDHSLMNNPIWKLQLQLAAVSMQSTGQPNVYARQNAMKKYLSNQQQQAQFLEQQRQSGAGGPLPSMQQQPAIGHTPLATQTQSATLQQQNPQMAEASMSLVDKTKQLLVEMATEIGKENTASNTASSVATSAAATVATNGPLSTPTTPKTELHTLRDQLTGTPALLLQHKKLSQFNIDEDDEVENNLITLKAENHDDQLWHAIDFSNLQISNISPNLFKYTFLSRLYLNGNNLTSVPSEIRELKNLRVLDLSHNKLTSLPGELGSCYQLKYLYFFDNMISTLPWEFGSLFNLQFLGCEGNPLDRHLLKILTEKSVTGLVFYLRDNRPEVPLTKDREFIEINTDGEVSEIYNSLSAATENLNKEVVKRSFTIMSYNMLCQHYATPKMYRYTPSWALSWEYRRQKLTEEIMSYMTDIICLQEVEAKTYEEYWAPLMLKQGYSGVFHAKTRAKTMHSKDSKKVDGCCIFYKESEFKVQFKDEVDFSGVWMKHKKFQRTEDYLNRAMNKDNVVVYIKLHHQKSGESIWIATTHLHWDPQFNDVKTFQVGVLMDHLEELIKEYGNPSSKQDPKKCPVIICGDFNSQKDSAVYELLSTGRVQSHKDIDGRDFGYMSQKNFAHNLTLKSSYSYIGELPLTNFTPSFTSTIDYIWFSTQALRIRGLLGEIDDNYISKFIGFPNDRFPSDHIPILARFEFTKGGPGGSRKI